MGHVLASLTPRNTRHAGHDTTTVSRYHQRTNPRFTETYRSSKPPHIITTNIFKIKSGHNWRASITVARSHPPSLIANTQEKASHALPPLPPENFTFLRREHNQPTQIETQK
ncbi:hypothetical protein Bca52824_026032 [Brassica carinata]|uniref:Uncharacterized protein n=1 Tax=Brassica carinata TaxID=52824 RepID=A0A8X7V8G2_BRACI|nr:hypothetical protein Bca52824_026032 [Brassica carinata]